VVEVMSDLNSEDSKSVVAPCPPGQVALSGGAQLGGQTLIALQVSDFQIDDNGDRVGWVARATEMAPIPGAWILVAHALCGTATS
jgi:hypothetical protein